MILITGATGIVGSHILAELVRNGRRDIRLLTRPNASREAILKLFRSEGLSVDNLTFLVGDVNDRLSVDHAVRGCREVYHCAALVSFMLRDEDRLYDVNTRGTANVVNAALLHGVEKFCHISSTASIGDVPINGFLTEASPWTTDRGRSHYALSKRYAELEINRAREEGLNALIVNPSVVIGPGKWGQSSTSMIHSSRNGMTFYPPGSNAFVDARDIARFCTTGMEQKWFDGRYLLIGENLSFREIFQVICTALGKRTPSIGVPEGPISQLSRVVRLMELFGIPVGVTSENLKSSVKSPRYSNERARSKGFEFTPISEAVRHAVMHYRQR